MNRYRFIHTERANYPITITPGQHFGALTHSRCGQWVRDNRASYESRQQRDAGSGLTVA